MSLLFRRASAVEKFPRVTISCSKCGEMLARYHKRNATKSHLVKMFVSRIADDPHHLFAVEGLTLAVGDGVERSCPPCGSCFCRGPRNFKGQPAWKIIGGNVLVK